MAEAKRPAVGGSTRTAGIIGWPVEHSLSPVIHNAAFAALGLDWVYVPLPVEPGRLAEALAGLSALGFSGANVTMPHKAGAASLMDRLTDDARRLQAVNTIVVKPQGLEGHNTDSPGFDRFLRRDAGFDPRGKTALLYGAGGAARASALALARAALARLFVAARDPAKVQALVSSLEGLDTEVVAIPFGEAPSLGADLVLNATPLGAEGQVLPLPPLESCSLVVDLLYQPSATPLLSAAKEAGVPAFGGLGLLLHQAALSFEIWTGQPAPIGVMSAAAVASLT